MTKKKGQHQYFDDDEEEPGIMEDDAVTTTEDIPDHEEEATVEEEDVEKDEDSSDVSSDDDDESDGDEEEEEESTTAIPSIRFEESDTVGGGVDIEDIDDITETTETVAPPSSKDNKKNYKSVKHEAVPANERITKPFLTKYEKTRIIATRAQQIANGSMPLIEFDAKSKFESVDLATEELRQKKTPLIVRRTLPNGMYEDWKVAELVDQDPDDRTMKKKKNL